MCARSAYQRQTASVAIAVICMIGMGGPVRAEPISGLIVEQTPDPATTGSLPEALGRPPPYSGGLEDVRDNATVAKPAQEQLGRDGQSPSPPNSRAKRPAAPSRSQTNESTGSPQGATDVHEDWTLDREIKEAVRPLYEDLRASGVVEAVRGLKSDLGLNSSSSPNAPTSSDDAKDSGNSAPREFASAERLGDSYAPQDSPRSATQVEQDKLAAAAAWQELVEEVKPWLFALAGLYVLGYMTKLGLNYFQWKATRSPKRGSRGTRSHRRHHRHRRPQGTTDKSGA